MNTIKDEINLTKISIAVEAQRIAQDLRQVIGEKNDLFLTLEQIDVILKNACPANCHYADQFGFVPEAGCPVHDY